LTYIKLGASFSCYFFSSSLLNQVLANSAGLQSYVWFLVWSKPCTYKTTKLGFINHHSHQTSQREALVVFSLMLYQQ